MDTNIIFGNIVYIIIALFLLKGALYMVKQQTAVVIERLGKFHKVSRPGLQFKLKVKYRKNMSKKGITFFSIFISNIWNRDYF